MPWRWIRGQPRLRPDRRCAGRLLGCHRLHQCGGVEFGSVGEFDVGAGVQDCGVEEYGGEWWLLGLRRSWSRALSRNKFVAALPAGDAQDVTPETYATAPLPGADSASRRALADLAKRLR